MSDATSFELSTTIDAASMQVLFAFVDVDAIKTWWKPKNAVVDPRPGGLFVITADASGQDELLGPLGGVLAGTLDKSMAGHFVYFGALHWLTPRGEVFGPTRLEVDVFSKGDPRRKPTLLRVRRAGFQSGTAWQRYLQLERAGWEQLLPEIKKYCEAQAPLQAETEILGLGGSYLSEAVLKERRIS